MTVNNAVSIIFRILVIIVVALFVVFVVPKIIMLILPILIGYLVAMMAGPIVKLLESKLRFPRKLASFTAIIIVVGILGGILAFLLSKIISEIHAVLPYIEDAYKWFPEWYNTLVSRVSDIFEGLPSGVTQYLQGAIQAGSTSVSDIIKGMAIWIVNAVGSTMANLPLIIFFTAALLLSAFFISSDYEIMKKGLRKVIMPSIYDKMASVRHDLFFALGGYFRAQLILMGIVFVEIAIGLSAIGNKYALLLAILIAIFDALPFFGSGGILIPWAIISFILGDVSGGISPLVIYAVVVITRQMLEPKLISDQIGIHPIITLTAMYAGFRIFGVVGIILAPIIVIIIKNLYKSGLFDKFLSIEK